MKPLRTPPNRGHFFAGFGPNWQEKAKQIAEAHPFLSIFLLSKWLGAGQLQCNYFYFFYFFNFFFTGYLEIHILYKKKIKPVLINTYVMTYIVTYLDIITYLCLLLSVVFFWPSEKRTKSLGR